MEADRSGSVKPGDEGPTEVKVKSKIRSASKRGQREEKGVKMSPKVLETWVNETLQDADHMDIPGMALKAEAK